MYNKYTIPKEQKLPVYAGWFFEKNVLVTGATSGIGREIAKLLVAYGAKVLICGRDVKAMDSLLEELKMASSRVLECFLVDLSNDESLQELISKINGNYSIDILINNAGIGYMNDFWEMSRDTITSMEGVNLIAVVELCRAFLPGMMEKSGTGILNVGSVASFFPTPGSALYGATKHFILAFTDALHRELISKGVHITGIYPGNTKSLFMERATKGRIKARRKSMHPALVAELALNCLSKNKIRVIPGFGNKIRAFVAPIMPVSILLNRIYTHTIKLLSS